MVGIAATKNCTLYFVIIILGPLLGWLVHLLFYKKNSIAGSRAASLGMWAGLSATLMAWGLGWPLAGHQACGGFTTNPISWLMATLILFVSAVVHHFSMRYMGGDRCYRRYFLGLGLITISTLLMAAADHVLLFIFLWIFSNLILVLLMRHKSQWIEAKNSSVLALNAFILGLCFLSAGTGLLAYASGGLSLSLITAHSAHLSASIRMPALFLIMLAALTQSGGWPFHRWLLSSLNSPTPVSALMHAGLVNGGGLLLVRFAPVVLHERVLLDILFALAVVTLILGGIWKLMQSDIKRMLACSTMTQMGFMLMQCGLGLFPAALAHLCWHALFKSFLFLKSGSTLSEHRHSNEDRLSTLPLFVLSALCGLMGAAGFLMGSLLPLTPMDTTSVLLFFSWMASTQLAHTLLKKRSSPLFILLGSLLCLTTGLIYGLTVTLIEAAVAPMQIAQPQPLHLIHLAAVASIFLIWIGLNLKPLTHHEGSLWWRRFYVALLNASQPHASTVTSHRSGYKF